MKKIITTVGTSLFTNYQKPQTRDSFDNYKSIDTQFEKLQNLYSEKYNEEDSNIKHLIKIIKSKWFEDEDGEQNLDASAEIKSILKIARVEEPTELKEKVSIVLIATDTVLSKLACTLIHEWFKPYQNFVFKDYVIKNKSPEENYTIASKGHVVEDLSVNSESDYDKGFMNLIKVLDDLKLNQNDVLNITGGYKALIPIMTIYGQLKNIPLKYIYNESELNTNSNLIEIFSLPINYDTGVAELYTFFLDNTYLSQTDINKGIVEKLKSWKLIDLHNEVYRVSAFGLLFRSLMEANIQGGKGVLGNVMELKLFEFFYDNGHTIFGNNLLREEKYIITKKGLKIGSKGLDIDLAFKNNKDEFAFCEVKSIKHLTHENSVEGIVKDIQKRYEAAKEDGINLKNYVLIIHKASFQNISYTKKALEKMKNSTNDLGLNFFVYYYDIPINKSNDNFNYQRFVQEPLENENFIAYLKSN